MIWLQYKYVSLLGAHLDRFVQKEASLWNFRCPLCGDSASNKSKARGYIFEGDVSLRFSCHNCQESLSFDRFLNQVNSRLYQQYRAEKFKESRRKNNDNKIVVPPKTITQLNRPLVLLKKISALDPKHPCKKYVVSRQIPTRHHAKLFWSPTFKEWTNKIIPGKFENPERDEGRLIIPFFDPDGNMTGYQGRLISDHGGRGDKYITIVMDRTKPVMWGLDQVDFNRDFIAVEGPIDAMFLPNAVASLGGVIQATLKTMSVDHSRCTLVYDNEPRNSQVVRNMLTGAEAGFRVFIWPKVDLKDVNAFILAKVQTREYVDSDMVALAAKRFTQVVEDCSFEGLRAILEINKWKMC